MVDANILLYARDADSRHHSRAREWLEDALNGPVRIGLPWESLCAFLRIATHPRASGNPLAPAEAFRQVNAWIAAPAAWIPTPTARHSEVLGDLIEAHEVRGNLIPDAHLAAIAICHGVAVYSADTDFARFGEVRWVNPLV
ncbi:MAG: TA system VapC family ribonuclease toxin [Solirubrobacterales bacterium]